ncbi:MAG: Rieske 2Fe-2S domain-containing protein [Pyrinomonadaceae bacterium]
MSTSINHEAARVGVAPEGHASRQFDLGPEPALAELPARVSVGGLAYYLVRAGAGYQLLSTVCPHQGGEVLDKGACFECPHHGWRFAHDTGRCLNAPAHGLSTVPVVVRDGRLYVEALASPQPTPRAPRRGTRPDQLTIRLHGHACLEIDYRGFSLLTDPWLVGPAFFGSWTQYPPPLVEPSALRPQAILVTHEHSDHFSETTLRHFDRATPVYVPDFPNRRLPARLAALGFAAVTPLSFGKTHEIAEGISLTCYEPESLWNDCIVLTEIDGFRLLNLNDAGLNRRIAAQVAPVDVVAAQFSTGASGYPLTWDHLSAAEKVHITERARQGKLQMLKEAMELYGGEFLLPFASHFALWHPSHREFMRMLRVNTIDDVVRAFEGSETGVLDLLPGESWDAASGRIERAWPQRGLLFKRAQVLKHLAESFDQNVFEQHHAATDELTREEVEEYFLRLNETPEIAFCENLTVRMRAVGAGGGPDNLEVAFEVADGRLRILPAAPETPNLTLEMPAGILRRTIAENLSWDEAFIGYWCRFTRNPNVYHAGFWRMLQAPYFAKPAVTPAAAAVVGELITSTSVIAEVLEVYGGRAERILRRHGLYCAGCQHSTFDSIDAGAKSHGLDKKQSERLVRELNRALHGAAPSGPETVAAPNGHRPQASSDR